MIRKAKSNQKSIFIPQQEESIYVIPTHAYKNSEMKNYFDQVKSNPLAKGFDRNSHEKIAKKNNDRNSHERITKKNNDRNSHERITKKNNESIEINQLSRNIIVVEEEQKLTSLEYQYQMLNRLPQQITSGRVIYRQTNSSSLKDKNQKDLKRIRLQKVQKIVLFTNYLTSFENLAFQRFTLLKQLDLSQNLIAQIPSTLVNQNLISLQILKLNSNLITVLPYLKHINVLQMLQNPLKMVTSKINSMNLNSLHIDWLQYFTIRHPSMLNYQESGIRNSNKKLPKSTSSGSLLKQKKCALTPIQVFKYEFIKKLNTKFDNSVKFYDFQTIINLRVKQTDWQEMVCQLLYAALDKQHIFFIQYLSKHYPNLHYNKMNIYNKFILQTALQMRICNLSKSVMHLFKPSQWPYKTDFPFYDNLTLGIKHQSTQFISSQILYQKKDHIIELLLASFKQSQDFRSIATIIFDKISAELQRRQQKSIIQVSLAKFPLHKSKAILAFWDFISRSKKYKNLMAFTKRSSYFQNSFVHFCIKSHKIQIFLDFLSRKQNRLEIFQRNSLGQTAKCQSSCDKLCKKMLWNQQKKYLNNLQTFKNVNTVSKLQKQSLKKLLTIPYLKLSQIRAKNLKSIIRMLQISFPALKSIFNSCNQNQYFENEQQMLYIIFQLLQKSTQIKTQLGRNQANIILYSFQAMIFKLFQTQIFDKRTYLAGQIAKNLIKNNKKDKKLTVFEEKVSEQNVDQLSFVDNQLLLQYELLHSIPVLKTQRFLASSPLNAGNLDQGPQKMFYLDLGKLGCKKCY